MKDASLPIRAYAFRLVGVMTSASERTKTPPACHCLARSVLHTYIQETSNLSLNTDVSAPHQQRIKILFTPYIYFEVTPEIIEVH